MPYAAPRKVSSVDDCWFYHVMDLPGTGKVGGQWDLRGRIKDYIGGVDVAGKRVLDVGTASGFLTFEMEKLGAEVVSLDADGPHCFFSLPVKSALFMKDRAHWERYTRGLMDRMNNGYWHAHRLYQSKARVVYANACAIPADIGEFDVAVMGQILVHMSDPVRAICSTMARCRGRMVITEGMVGTEDPIMMLCGRAPDGPPEAWWQLSLGLYRQLFAMAGFEVERVTKSNYRCQSPGMADHVELTTIVARRT